MLVACGGATRGSLTPLPVSGASAESLVEVTTSEADGLRVLWHGATQGESGSIHEQKAWVAANSSQLDDLWQAAGRPAPAPRVDFQRYVVFGIVQGGGVCPKEITGARGEAGSVLRLVGTYLQQSCVDLLTRVAEVVAVPRRLLPRQLTLVSVSESVAFEFDVPDAPELQPSEPPAEAPTLARVPLGQVAVPQRGHLALATLSDGTDVWVVQHANGERCVLSASVAVRDTSYSRMDRALDVTTAWDASSGRFLGGYDAYGRNVHGWAPLVTYHFTPLDADTLRVDGLAPMAPGPIQPAAAAPVLEGPPRAYLDRSPVARLDDIAPAHVALLQADVVWGTSGPARLCQAPAAAVGRFAGCAETAPVVEGSPALERAAVLVLEGPVLVRRKGPQLAHVTLIGQHVTRVLVPKP